MEKGPLLDMILSRKCSFTEDSIVQSNLINQQLERFAEKMGMRSGNLNEDWRKDMMESQIYKRLL